MKLDTAATILAWAEDSQGCSHPDCGNSVCDLAYATAERLGLAMRVLAIIERDGAEDKCGLMHPNGECGLCDEYHSAHSILAEAAQKDGQVDA